ncbi:MAG: hypothetical protein ACOYLQ_08985 [Hyphomicrobiaceae bacterium]
MDEPWFIPLWLQLVLLAAIVVLVVWRIAPLIGEHLKGGGGWGQLEPHYAVEPCSVAGAETRQTVQVGRVVYRNCVTVGASDAGLYLEMKSPLPIWRKPPLLIPWSAMTHIEQVRLFWQPAAMLHIGRPALATMTLPRALFRSIRSRLPATCEGAAQALT